jgi:hypothetical protein
MKKQSFLFLIFFGFVNIALASVTVRLSDGTSLEFPDGTSKKIITDVVSKVVKEKNQNSPKLVKEIAPWESFEKASPTIGRPTTLLFNKDGVREYTAKELGIQNKSPPKAFWLEDQPVANAVTPKKLANEVTPQSCYQSSISIPAPFLGNHDEVFKLADGSAWKVIGSFEYLYAYYPRVTVCPSLGKLLVGNKTMNIQRATQSSSSIRVVLKRSGCSGYFLADGDSGGVYLLEWYGGYDPSVGDSIAGDLKSYGMKDVIYTNNNQTGRVYVDDYSLSKSSAIEKIKDKCN